MSRVKDERDSFCTILKKEPMQHLRIPPEFSRLYLRELPDTVILKGPSGNEWLAKLYKDADFVYIQDDGWRNFHRDNALGNSEFLRFQYNGKNCFKVQVFDPTGVERLEVAGAGSMGTKNPSGRRSRGRPRKHPAGSRDLPLSKSPNSQGIPMEENIRKATVYIGGNPSGRRSRGRPRKHPAGSRDLPLSKSPNSQGIPMEENIRRATVYIGGKDNPEIEQDKLEKIQVEESLTKLKEEEMDLPDVKMSSEPGKHKKKNKQRQVKAGNLSPHIPDCKSNILRRSLEKNASSSEKNARLRAVKETFTSNFPFFMSYMRRPIPEKGKLLPIPSKFAKEHLLWQRANVVLQNAEGKTWEVACHCNSNRHYFSGGWPAFFYDNELKIGDVCIFEVLKEKEFRVHIYRLPGTSAR